MKELVMFTLSKNKQNCGSCFVVDTAEWNGCA